MEYGLHKVDYYDLLYVQSDLRTKYEVYRYFPNKIGMKITAAGLCYL